MENQEIQKLNPEPFDDIVQSTIEDIEKLRHYSKQQDRTIKLKRALLQMRRKYPLENIIGLCQAVGIKSTKTFYNWFNNDVYFRSAYEMISDIWYDSAMDMLKIHVFVKNNGWAVRYFLSNFHPGYMTQRKLDESVVRYLAEKKRKEQEKLLKEGMCNFNP